MSQHLSTYTIVALYHYAQDQRHFLTNKSLIKNKIYLSSQAEQKDFQNALFYIQVEGNNMEFNVPIEYDQPIYLRHMISQKYLTLAVDEEQQKQISYRLVLGTEKKYFRINACYQYQTKISTKIKFNEQIYLSTEYTESRQGMVVVEKITDKMELFLGFSFGSKLQFHYYSTYEKQEKYYKHGKIVWLSHIESQNFLSIASVNGRQEVVFEPIQMQKQIQNMSALWVVQSKKLTQSNHLKYDEEVRFKNILSGQYLSFSRNYKLIDNERIYQIFLEQNGGDHSRFLFRPIQQKQQKQIDRNAYLLLLHYESHLFLGCRKQKVNQSCFKLLTFPYMEDQDLFKLHSFSNEEEQALRFIVAIRGEFRDIGTVTRIPLRDVSIAQVTEIQETYHNIKIQFANIKQFEKLFEFVRNELGPSIRQIASNLSFFRGLTDLEGNQSASSKSSRIRAISTRILDLAYHILCVFCENHNPNQMISFEYLNNYLTDVGQNVGAQEAVMETFRNNNTLLPKASSSLSRDGNIVRIILTEFNKKNPLKNEKYWQNLRKIIQVLNVLIFYNNMPLDINQNLISHQLFKNGFYERIILPIQVVGARIVIQDPQTGRTTSIENISNESVNTIVELLLLLFSNLTCNHSFNSKNYIHSYLAEYNQACLSVMIAYLNKPIRKGLYNQLLNFVSKTYLDSSPRLKRIKPLPFIFFHFQPQKSHAELEEGYMSQRLREMLMLKAEESRVCKPLHYSNLLPESMGYTVEPSMSEEQLVTFRLNLTEKILRSKDVSEPQLQTISLLMKLECYTMNEMLQLYEELKRKLLLKEVNQRLQVKVLGIINELYQLLLELQTKKSTIYLKYKFLQNQKEDLPENQYKYVLPLSSRMPIPMSQKMAEGNSQYQPMNSARSDASENLVHDYNELRDTLALMHASPELKQSIVKYFCSFKEDKLKGEQAATYLQSLFNLILKTHLPKYKFLTLLSKSTVLTHDEVSQFDQLFSTSKKFLYLILISDYWMVGDNEPQSCQHFLKHLKELTNFLYEETQSQAENNQKKKVDVSTKRQLFMSSLGVHKMVLQLLQKNAYLVSQIQSKKELPKKYKQIFEACFEFIYCFIKQCSENKKSIQDFLPVLLLYQNFIQLGQLKVYTELFRDEKDFVKELNFTFVENIITRLAKVKQDGKNDLAEYNPDYLQLLIVMINSLDIESRFFVEKLYHLISKPDIFERLLFLNDSRHNKDNIFCLKMNKIKLDPLQLPILYHQSLLELFDLMLNEAPESIKNSFKLKFTQTFKVSYLFQVLAQPDIFMNTGIQPQLNWIIKQQVHKIMHIYLEKSELASEIYESETLTELLQYWLHIFIKKPQRREMTDQSQSFYLPFMHQIGEPGMTLQKMREQYYYQHVKPFVAKLVTIFDKQKLHGQVRTHSPINYIYTLKDALNNEFKEINISRIGTSSKRSYGLKDVKLKWRNFVDDDEDNSEEEKYVKKAILDILKNKKSADYIDSELKAFYKVIDADSKSFISSMVYLLKILFSSKDIMEGRKQQSRTAVNVLKYLSSYIEYRSQASVVEGQKGNQIELITKALEECRFIEIFTELTGSKEFELRKRHLKTIFHYCLKIVNFLLHHDQQQRFNRQLFKIFKQNARSYKFLQFLKEGALEIISTIDPHSHYQQINSSLSQMRLCIDSKPLNLHEQAYLTLTYLCKHEPFTYYLRNQQSAFADTDFLDKIYNILLFLFKHDSFSRSITVSSVRAAQHILDFICSMLTGPNQPNQNYLIDNKFPQFVLRVLKLEDIPPCDYEFQAQRGDLLNKIVQFYRSNGIQIEELLQSKIKLIDFRHIYILNRFKCILIKTLLECLIANENNLVRVKMDIPVQIIKLNFIWVYQTYKKGKYEYQQKHILRERAEWCQLIENNKVDPLFLRLGFYYYQLIELYEQKEAEGESLESDEKIINEEKEKERIVKKFFATIKEGKREKQKQSMLEKEQLKQEMKYYFHAYYNALIFFKNKIGTIEVDLKGDIVKVYFPHLPIAEKITQDMKEEFKIGVNRLDRNQKIKSLIEYENQFYEDLKGQEDYFNEIQRKMPILGPVLRMMKYQDEFLLVALINSFLISMLYWLNNYEAPSHDFNGQLLDFVAVGAAPKNIIMLLFSILNFLVGIVNGIYLFTRKIPLRKKLLTLKFADLQVKQKGKQDTPTNQTLYVWSNITKEAFYNLYIVIFLLLTILHPFFSCFILVELIGRIEMGRFIIRSIKETWFQLFVAIGLLGVFNIFFVQIFYGFYTSATGYGTMCSSQYTCMLLLMDQNLKGGGGVLGNVDSDFTYMVITSQVLAQILYIVISIKVIAEIFSGTIIDKFSQLREEQQNIEEDQNKICFICGQERFDLDLEYEGFTTHTENNHQIFNYIKRCQARQYGIIERYIQQQRLKQIQKWIPQDNSLAKQTKQKQQEEKKGENDIKEKVMIFVKDKLRDMKRVRQRVELMTIDVKREKKSLE